MQLLNPNNYEKGGWVLHMLRRKLGDTAFWKGMVDYFAAYKNRNASSADFEHTMEKAGGQSLETFFHQWLYVPGHPRLGIGWSYEPGPGADGGMLTIKIEQQQNTLYEFPLEYALGPANTAPAGDVLAAPTREIHSILIRDRTTTVQLRLAARPTSLIMDPAVNLLADFDVSAQ
jgi:aminopeptidase N